MASIVHLHLKQNKFPLIFPQILAGLYNPDDGHIDPYSLTQALAIGARRHGVKIQQQTPVEAMLPLDNGEWDVKVPQGTIRAGRVVNATGTFSNLFRHFDEVAHIYTTKIDGVVCPPNISETVAGRLMKLAHRQRIASTTILFFF